VEPAWVAERERASPVPAPAAVFSSAMPDEPQLMLETGPPCAFWLFSCRPQRVPAPAALLVTRAWMERRHANRVTGVRVVWMWCRNPKGLSLGSLRRSVGFAHGRHAYQVALWVHRALRRNFVRRYGKILPTTDDCSDPDHWIELVEIYRLIRRKKNVTLFFFRT
jgi:hypothetical protein